VPISSRADHNHENIFMAAAIKTAQQAGELPYQQRPVIAGSQW
jgi:hypothetical protein